MYHVHDKTNGLRLLLLSIITRSISIENDKDLHTVTVQVMISLSIPGGLPTPRGLFSGQSLAFLSLLHVHLTCVLGNVSEWTDGSFQWHRILLVLPLRNGRRSPGVQRLNRDWPW